ncbi:MAG: hypothetical protein J7K54_04840 [Candidatus Aenigmarchaeota archaeon]|nr:hypothetical protein [Candidatus Aenigmarchaeota archaeon]
MKNLTVGIFNDEELGALLGKRGTDTDIRMFNRKENDIIYTFMHPVEGRPVPKSQIMSAINAAIVSFEKQTPELGESILMLDAAGISQGIAIVPEGTDVKSVIGMTKGTSLEGFVMLPRDQHRIIEALSKMHAERDSAGPASVIIDQAFSVRGVGEVALGFVKTGTVKRHQKLMHMQAGKEVVIRSIQMHDKDFEEAGIGSRVGLAVKGVTAEEMKRGTVLSENGVYMLADNVKLEFRENRFYGGAKEGKFHATVGMQSFPVELSFDDGKAVAKADRKVAYRKGETFFLLDLNAEKVHLIGSGRPL